MKKTLQEQLDEARAERKKLFAEIEQESKTEIRIIYGLLIMVIFLFVFALF